MKLRIGYNKLSQVVEGIPEQLRISRAILIKKVDSTTLPEPQKIQEYRKRYTQSFRELNTNVEILNVAIKEEYQALCNIKKIVL